MSFFVNTPQEEAYRLVMDYFKGRRMKILTSNSPSYVRARFGAWVSMSFGNAQGEVEANIPKKDGGSYVNLNLNFLIEYLGNLMLAIIGVVIIHVIMWWLATTNPLEKPDFPAVAPWFALWLSVISFLLVMGVAGYNVSLTRRRFMEEFNMFIQSLASKRE